MNKKEGYDTFTKDDGTTYKICNNCKYLNPYNILSHDEKEFSFCELLSEDSMGHLPNLPSYRSYTVMGRDELGNFSTPNTFEFGRKGNRCPFHLSIERNEKLKKII